MLWNCQLTNFQPRWGCQWPQKFVSLIRKGGHRRRLLILPPFLHWIRRVMRMFPIYWMENWRLATLKKATKDFFHLLITLLVKLKMLCEFLTSLFYFSIIFCSADDHDLANWWRLICIGKLQLFSLVFLLPEDLETLLRAPTRILKKKKLKINVHRPVGTRVSFDDDGNPLAPLAKLADIKSSNDTFVVDKGTLSYL